MQVEQELQEVGFSQSIEQCNVYALTTPTERDNSFLEFVEQIGDFRKTLIPQRLLKYHFPMIKGYFPRCDTLTKWYLHSFHCYTQDENKYRWKKLDSQILIWTVVKMLQRAQRLQGNVKELPFISDCEWEQVAKILGLSAKCIKKQWHVLQKKLVKDNPWGENEDKILSDFILDHGQNCEDEQLWKKISDLIFEQTGQYRSSRQVRCRYYNHIDDKIMRNIWQLEEDTRLLELIRQMGEKWATIASLLPGRNYNSVKNRYKILRKERKLLNKIQAKRQKISKKQKAKMDHSLVSEETQGLRFSNSSHEEETPSDVSHSKKTGSQNSLNRKNNRHISLHRQLLQTRHRNSDSLLKEQDGETAKNSYTNILPDYQTIVDINAWIVKTGMMQRLQKLPLKRPSQTENLLI